MAKTTKKHIRPVAETLDQVLSGQQWGNQIHLFALVRHWPEIAGSEIACHSMPAFFRRDVLWIYVRGSIWIQQMHLVKLELLNQTNAFLKGRHQVTDLRWMVQPAELIDQPFEKYVSPPIKVDPEAERKFRIMAENLPDPETREALCNLWLRLTTKNNEP
jgi:hypothetical protein